MADVLVVCARYFGKLVSEPRRRRFGAGDKNIALLMQISGNIVL